MHFFNDHNPLKINNNLIPEKSRNFAFKLTPFFLPSLCYFVCVCELSVIIIAVYKLMFSKDVKNEMRN